MWIHIQQLIVEVLFLGTASVSGLYYRIMSDAAHNRTVDGTRTGIQQRVKLECEREQQEQLLLSVIPAYIAAEVRLQSIAFFFFCLLSGVLIWMPWIRLNVIEIEIFCWIDEQIFQVKRSIMLKMADACQRGGQQTNRFHEMHVQRHNNVTILYADIVNFTPLSEQLTASDLVKTLNELFGRFDQIAQVSECSCIM